MSEKAIEAICGVLDRCSSILTYDSIIADDILVALKAARIALVELPQPMAPIVSGEFPRWEVDDMAILADTAFGQVLFPGYEFDTAIARDIAAALLAAADAAEAVTS